MSAESASNVWHVKPIKTNEHQPKSERLERKTRPDFDLDSYAALERMQMIWLGLYPISSDASFREKLIHSIRFTITLTTGTALTASMITALALGVKNLTEIIEILYYLITQGAYLIKLVNLIITRHKIPYIEKHVKHPIIYRYYHLFGSEGLDDISKICVNTARSFRTCVFFCMSFYVVVPIISPSRLLPLRGWFPIDVESNLVFLFVLQMTCMLISCGSNVAIDIYTSHCISLAVGELRLLKLAFMNVDYRLGDYEGDDDGRLKVTDNWELVGRRMDKDEEKFPKLRPGNLKELVFMHKHAITLTNMIEYTFSYGIFCQFLASMVVICMSGLQMLTVPLASIEFLLFLFYFLSMMTQISGCCYIGNEVIFESSMTGEGCYMSNWYEGKLRHKTTLLIVMERGKRQIALSAGKFFFLSLTTYVSIMKSSYSYFAVLRRFYQNS